MKSKRTKASYSLPEIGSIWHHKSDAKINYIFLGVLGQRYDGELYDFKVYDLEACYVIDATGWCINEWHEVWREVKLG